MTTPMNWTSQGYLVLCVHTWVHVFEIMVTITQHIMPRNLASGEISDNTALNGNKELQMKARQSRIACCQICLGTVRQALSSNALSDGHMVNSALNQGRATHGHEYFVCCHW